MAVPDFQSVMRPVLVVLADGEDHRPKSIREGVAAHFDLSEDALNEEIPSGRAKTFHNRVGWAITYLYRAGLVQRPKHAVYRITDRGRQVLMEHPERVDLKVLSQFDEFNEFKQTSKTTGDDGPPSVEGGTDDQTPEERIETSYRELRSALAAELLDRVMDQSPGFFEQLVLDVLYRMGYGGRRDDAAQRLGQSGDEGVDGVIREDRLGLDQIYVQAKRWQNPVGRPEIQKFFGALHGKRATKGVFITTSAFSKEAIDFADSVTPRVILIDGKELAQLMIDHGVGVTVAREYALKRLDLDYFTTEDDSEVLVEVPTLVEEPTPAAEAPPGSQVTQ
jgi:restriction system protein